jgi:hypothetical protein
LSVKICDFRFARFAIVVLPISGNPFRFKNRFRY